MFHKREKHSEGTKEIDLGLSRYDYTLFFDGACTRQRTLLPLGAFAFVVLNNKGETVY